jgi:hypothetical protein
MNWFKLIKFANAQIAQTIALWLEQARSGNLNMQGLDADINQLMAGVTDPAVLEQGINGGVQLYRTKYKQNGPLLPIQDELINNLKRRFANPAAQKKPGMNPQMNGPVQDSFPPLPEPSLQQPAVDGMGETMDGGTGESNV